MKWSGRQRERVMALRIAALNPPSAIARHKGPNGLATRIMTAIELARLYRTRGFTQLS